MYALKSERGLPQKHGLFETRLSVVRRSKVDNRGGDGYAAELETELADINTKSL